MHLHKYTHTEDQVPADFLFQPLDFTLISINCGWRFLHTIHKCLVLDVAGSVISVCVYVYVYTVYMYMYVYVYVCVSEYVHINAIIPCDSQMPCS